MPQQRDTSLRWARRGPAGAKPQRWSTEPRPSSRWRAATCGRARGAFEAASRCSKVVLVAMLMMQDSTAAGVEGATYAKQPLLARPSLRWLTGMGGCLYQGLESVFSESSRSSRRFEQITQGVEKDGSAALFNPAPRRLLHPSIPPPPPPPLHTHPLPEQAGHGNLFPPLATTSQCRDIVGRSKTSSGTPVPGPRLHLGWPIVRSSLKGARERI